MSTKRAGTAVAMWDLSGNGREINDFANYSGCQSRHRLGLSEKVEHFAGLSFAFLDGSDSCIGSDQ
jgi:hypothetical protein